MTDRRAGFVALVGEPNVGKSTLLNRLVGSNVSVVTHKAQTTRFRIRGICIQDEAQLVFVDTPGLFDPKSRLDKLMVDAAWKSMADADIVVAMADAAAGRRDSSRTLLDQLAARVRTGQPLVLVLNKVDRTSREALLKTTEVLGTRADFAKVFMISAAKGDGVKDLMAWLAENAPPGPWLFPEDQVSDTPVRMLAEEITRGRLLLRLHDEIPYRMTVETERWAEVRGGSVRVEQAVIVERDGHKGIVIGHGGRTIKQVSAEARAEIGRLLGCEVQLFLRVKVRPRWADNVASRIAATSGA